MGVSGASPAQSAAMLGRHGWALEVALEAWFAEGHEPEAPPAPAVDSKKILAMFEQYKEKGGEDITDEGIIRLCADINIDPEKMEVLVLAWKMGAKQMCVFTRPEFVKGCEALTADSMAKLKAAASDLRRHIAGAAEFRAFYHYVFDFARAGSTAKGLAVGAAVSMWRLVLPALPPPRFTHSEAWVDFMAKQKYDVTRDTWMQLLDFARTIHADLSNYDGDASSSSWATLIDEFVNSRRAAGAGAAAGAGESALKRARSS